MKRTILSAAVLVLLGGGVGVSAAEPGPNDPPGGGHGNTYGLCTAYFSGSDKGQEKKRNGQAFKGLEAAAEAADQTVAEYCAANGQKPGNG